MKSVQMFRKTLVVTAIATFVVAPAWAAEDASDEPMHTPSAETGQPMERTPQVPHEVPEPGLAAPESAMSQNPLYAHTPEELQRIEVIDPAGERVGRIKTIVLGPDGQSAHAVVSSGGFLGFGAKEVLVSLDELQFSGADQVQIGVLREDLLAHGDYEPEQYVEMEPDRPISEFSAFEPVPDEPTRYPDLPQAPDAPAR